MIPQLWRLRGLVWRFAMRELRARYMGSAMGVFWNVINPVAMSLIYIFVFTQVLPTRIAGSTDVMLFAIYLTSGLVAWNALNETIMRSSTAFLENATLIKKVVMPEEIYVAQVALSAGMNLFMAYTLLAVLFSVMGHVPPWTAVLIPVVALLQQVMVFGLGLLFSTVTVFFRDVPHVLGLFLQVWFWATPVVYLTSSIPERFRWVHAWNPYARFTDAYHALMVDGRLPSAMQWLTLLALALGGLLLGAIVFRRLRADMRDEL
jgi:lipopolysaccharide transport system permease protein